MFFFRKEKKDPKAQADDFFTKGQWSSALEAYEAVLAGSPQDVKLLRRVADLRAKLGRNAQAVEAYRQAADLYAASGFLVQAIAIQKILLRLDPSAGDVAKKLSMLYAERGITAFRQAEPSAAKVETPAAAAPDVEIEMPPLEARALPTIPLFSDLPRDVFLKVVDKLQPRQLSPGEFVFREGEPGDSIYVITQGVVEVNLKGKVIATLKEGEFFGEGSYFSREPRNAGVTAGSEPAELLQMHRQDLEDLISQYKVVENALKLFYKKRVVDRMLATSDMLVELSPKVRAELESIFREQAVGAGSVLVMEGSTERDLYFVVRGRFLVTTLHPVSGEVVQLSQIEPGQFFGEVALLTSGERTATVTAREDSEVLKVSLTDIAPYMERFPAIRQALEKARDERAAATVDVILGRRT